ncbi:small subunit rRNA maturation protein TSR4 [Kluyveromyces lactis]|uniref:KLLA0A10901p n=1 Tax=Kluyveromyces lactis (strain ATCC 8585 / CBS 2359 / DSM 70799 / NBRC 1267 / NRRL Y-1140 / WM37) TaxID=284590 RepID=Q6CX65_KLULA|nr:uncharacterized protein KLLA0_A10901g [Kluyveromyces lactis]CAH03062.1 KLLA0A10901p [Kluyveromyces lactis]|eukprot:XP_451474.1 uncharacterized protein KLLA0_A10901g [Kluyveromyces lactis]
MSNIEEIHSAGEEDEYDYKTKKKSDVYLGLVDAAIKEDDEVLVEDTFIGGEPCWLAPDSPPSEEILRCDSCKSADFMKLLVQAFAPVDLGIIEPICEKKKINLTTKSYINPDYTRVLYVFYCTKCKRKNGSVKCIRGVKKTTSVDTLGQKMEQLQTTEFQLNPFSANEVDSNSNKNPFDKNPFAVTGSKSGEAANPFAAAASNPFAQTENIKPEPKTGASNAPVSQKTLRKLHDQKKDKEFDSSKAFPGYFLFVEEETFKSTPDHLKLPKNLKIDKTALELPDDAFDSLEENQMKLDPRTEKISKFLDDDVFQKFQEVVSYNPGQVLRYDLGGLPLYYAKTPKEFEDLVAKPAYNPSSRRVFEMQLMPKMILDLEEEVSLTDGMDWGTIMVYTDIENYIPKFDENQVGYVQEVVKVQWEPIDYDEVKG